MLASAAAAKWNVPIAEVTISSGKAFHERTNRSASFGALANAASRLPTPADPKLKSVDRFRFIGKEGAVKKLDVPDKTNGKALFTMDAAEPDMLIAVVAHPPTFGATPRSFDDAKTRAEPGVVDVRPLSTGVAIYAKDTWSAIKGREALTVVWDESNAENLW